MAFNRVFREFRTWKHYRGGMADDVWIYDFKTGATENLTNNPAQDICPMWGPDNTIYFISDRDGRMNLFSIDLATKETKQLTHFKDFDIKFPSIGKTSIVFEQAGYIWRYDLASGPGRAGARSTSRKISPPAAPRLVDASKHIESVNLAPDGERAIVVARGDLFSVPAKERHAAQPDAKLQTRTSAMRFGRRTANGLPTTPTRPARTSSMSARRTAKASRNRSRTARDTYYYAADLVARQQEAALERSLAAAALCRCCEQSGDPGRPGQIRRDPGL